MKFTITMVAPVGRFMMKDIYIPAITEDIAIKDEKTMVFLKPFAIWSAVTAGNIRRADVSIIPTTLIARTTVIPVRRTSMEFIFFVFIPVTFANSSSKVVEKYSL